MYSDRQPQAHPRNPIGSPQQYSEAEVSVKKQMLFPVLEFAIHKQALHESLTLGSANGEWNILVEPSASGNEAG